MLMCILILVVDGCHVRLPSSNTLAQVTVKTTRRAKIQESEYAAKTDKGGIRRR